MADEKVRERQIAANRAEMARRLADPVAREIMRQNGYKFGIQNLIPGMTDAQRAAQTVKIRAKHLSWCPERHWETNRVLKANGYRLPERKAMIAAEVAREERDRLAAMTPLERQLERLNNGGRLIDKPTYRRADHDYSLTGNGMAML